MTDQDSDAMLDASAATDGADWLSRIQAMGEDAGTFEPLGAGHHAVFLDNAPTLLVTCDNYRAARGRPKHLPMGMQLADECDWSHLCLLSEAGPWYRDPAVYDYFDRLVDDGFLNGLTVCCFMGQARLATRQRPIP